MRKFMRTRSPPPPAPRTNGHAGGSRSTSGGGEGEGGGGAGWEDPEFPPTTARLYTRTRWMRPHELSARPTFLGVDPEGDEEGARWAGAGAVAGAAAVLAGVAPRLLARALPPRAGLDSARPYVFRFWSFGEWREVGVDDRVPARGRRPLHRSRLHHDYTLPLLVKAYAKLVGSYAAMSRDRLPDALRRLTGGVVQAVRPAARLALAAAPRATLAVALAPRAPPHLLLPPDPSAPHLLHLRSTSPHPPHPSDRWMSAEEFSATFVELVLVHVPPDEWAEEPALRGRRPWRAVVARRTWRPGVNAGGAPDACPGTADANPQFQVEVPEGVGACHVVVSLVQREERPAGAVGLAVYAVGAGAGVGRVPLRAMRALDAVRGRAPEVAVWFRLAGGRYAVVPHARRAHRAGDFLLRVLADDRVAVWESNEDNAVPRPLRAELEELAAAGVGRAERGAPPVPWAPGAAGALLAARDGALAGAVAADEAARLAALAARWRAAWGGARRRPALRLRALLAPVGVSVSNKVLEALVARFARDGSLSRADYVHALATLYLAHERHRLLDAKIKSNPISLEEMILLTIYS